MLLNGNDVREYEGVIARALNWVRQNQEKIAELEDVSAHYKAPYLYAAIGEPVCARKHTDLIIQRYLQPDGDFRTRPDHPGWPQEPSGPGNRYVYTDSWLIVGFHRLGLYGPANKSLKFVRRFQDQELGGFCSRFDLATGKIDSRYLDASSTSVAGLALLACGQVADAFRAGEFILRILDSQPDWNRYYFTSWDTNQGLMTDVLTDENPAALRGRRQFCVRTDYDAARESIWMPGLAMTFLGKLLDATGDARFLNGAKKLFDFFHRMDQARWENLSACKIMWSSAELYRLSGEIRYGETAKRLLNLLCERQHDWGGWLHTLRFVRVEDQPFGVTADIIFELCGEIKETVFNLSETTGKK